MPKNSDRQKQKEAALKALYNHPMPEFWHNGRMVGRCVAHLEHPRLLKINGFGWDSVAEVIDQNTIRYISGYCRKHGLAFSLSAPPRSREFYINVATSMDELKWV